MAKWFKVNNVFAACQHNRANRNHVHARIISQMTAKAAIPGWHADAIPRSRIESDGPDSSGQMKRSKRENVVPIHAVSGMENG